MHIDPITISLYGFLTILSITCYRIAVRGTPWNYAIAASFCIFLFIYNGIGLSNEEVDGLNYITEYTIYLSAFLLSFYLFSLGSLCQKRTQKPIQKILSKESIGDKIIWLYIASSLLPLMAPEFKINLLLSPPSFNFLEIFSKHIGDDVLIRKATRYLSLTLLAPFLISLGAQTKRPIKVLFVLVFLCYVEYVSGAYISRSSVLVNLVIYTTYIIHQYPKARVKIVSALLFVIPFVAIFSALFLSFRSGASGDHSVSDLLFRMIDIETNFPRDAGIPLYTSNMHGSVSDYLLWIFTIPIPKAFFGQFVNLSINYDIAYILTGARPGDMYFSVLLAGNLFSSIYSLDYLFWLEPIIAGTLAGIAYRIASSFKSPVLLSYIMVLCSFFYNRAGVAGFAPQIYNTIIWLPLWGAVAYVLANVKPLKCRPNSESSTLACHLGPK